MCGDDIMSEIQAEKVTESDLHKMVSSLYDIQHTRIIVENRFRGRQENNLIAFIEGMDSLEKNIKLLIKGDVQKYPIHEWIISQRGLSYDLAGQLIGQIQDIKRFDNISKLWAYFGLAVVDVCQDCGKRWYPITERSKKAIHISQRLMEQYEKKTVREGKADFMKNAMDMLCTCKEPHIKKQSQRHIAGTLGDFNPTAKMLAYKIGVQFVKQGDLYRKLYDQFKLEYSLRDDLKKETESKKGKVTKNGTSKGTAHIHAMAQRKTVKVFLSHLWAVWRKLEGLPVTKPYVMDRMGHSKYIEPQ